MKKRVAYFLLLTLLVITLIGCGGTNKGKSVYGRYLTQSVGITSSFHPYFYLNEDGTFEFHPEFNVVFSGEYKVNDDIVELIADESGRDVTNEDGRITFKMTQKNTLVLHEGNVMKMKSGKIFTHVRDDRTMID